MPYNGIVKVRMYDWNHIVYYTRGSDLFTILLGRECIMTKEQKDRVLAIMGNDSQYAYVCNENDSWFVDSYVGAIIPTDYDDEGACIGDEESYVEWYSALTEYLDSEEGISYEYDYDAGDIYIHMGYK